MRDPQCFILTELHHAPDRCLHHDPSLLSTRFHYGAGGQGHAQEPYGSKPSSHCAKPQSQALRTKIPRPVLPDVRCVVVACSTWSCPFAGHAAATGRPSWCACSLV